MADSKNIVYSVGWTPASVLVNSTGDAMDNIFDIYIDWPWGTSGTNGSISAASEAQVSYRAEGFTIPQPKTNTYKVTWNGITVHKVSSGVQLDRKFDITYRLDANYALYNKFIAWQKLTSDINTSGVANTASALGRVQVVAPGAEYNSLSWSTPDKASAEENLMQSRLGSTTLLAWTFEDVQCINVDAPKFKQGETGGKITYKVEFIFGDAAYPFYTPANPVAHNHKQ